VHYIVGLILLLYHLCIGTRCNHRSDEGSHEVSILERQFR